MKQGLLFEPERCGFQVERQRKENAKDFAVALKVGFREMKLNDSGWARFDLEDVKEIEFSPEKKGYVSLNSISIAKAPNGRFAYGIRCHVGLSGQCSGPSIWDTFYDTYEEVLQAAVIEFIEAVGQHRHHDETYAKKLIKEANQLKATN